MQLSERKVIFRDFCCAQGFVGALLTQGRGFQREESIFLLTLLELDQEDF